MPETENFGAKRINHFVGPDSWTFFELQHRKELLFLMKRVQSGQLKNHANGVKNSFLQMPLKLNCLIEYFFHEIIQTI